MARRKTRNKVDSSDDEETQSFDAATADIPTAIIKDLLMVKYQEKWGRLGLNDVKPVSCSES
jgi:hypothetical protein